MTSARRAGMAGSLPHLVGGRSTPPLVTSRNASDGSSIHGTGSALWGKCGAVTIIFPWTGPLRVLASTNG